MKTSTKTHLVLIKIQATILGLVLASRARLNREKESGQHTLEVLAWAAVLIAAVLVVVNFFPDLFNGWFGLIPKSK
ncbi:MAG: hypothetical protein L0G87_00470 [Renibacterium salmoninarum]|jgi:hypothetical protein|nr:hypothetical protein [Renibacterium salmoninarum]